MRFEFARFPPHAPNAPCDRGDQNKIQEPQLSIQNRDTPFCSGTSLRGITPDSVRRTFNVFSFGLAAEIRISLVASSAFSEVTAARKLTSCSIPHSNDTATETSP